MEHKLKRNEEISLAAQKYMYDNYEVEDQTSWLHLCHCFEDGANWADKNPYQNGGEESKGKAKIPTYQRIGGTMVRVKFPRFVLIMQDDCPDEKLASILRKAAEFVEKGKSGI